MRRNIVFGAVVFVIVAGAAYFLTLQFAGRTRIAVEVVIPPTIVALDTASNLPIPPLPFADNADPTACGAPSVWGGGGHAWLTGYYGGELVQPTVYLYDSHLRKRITGMVASGTEVTIVLYQQNPTLNYYMVQVPDGEGGSIQGWVPAPFVSLEPPAAETGA